MTMKPGDNSRFDLCLTDTRAGSEWNLKLEGGGRGVQRSSISEDQFGLYMRNVGKQLGGFDEQRTWAGGARSEFLSDNPDKFFDSLNCWTVNGHVSPTLQWKFATGYRVVDQEQWGDVTMKPLYNSAGFRYASRSFVAGANNTTDKCWAFIKRVGNPGTLTWELCANSGGSPSTVLVSKTVTTATITDICAVYFCFDFTSTQAITSGTTYHIKLYGDSTDNKNNHWEIGCNESGTGKVSTDNSSWAAATPDFSIYYRLTDADTARRWFLFGGSGTTFWAVDKKDSGNSQVYSIDTSAVLTEKTSSGLGTVTGRPMGSNGYYYFPQGESTNIREFDGTSTWADDGSNKATFLKSGYDSADGAVIWRANTTAGTTSSVSRAKVTTSGTDHTFGTAIPIGDLVHPINNIFFMTNNGLWVGKSDSIWNVINDRAVLQNFGIEKTPSTSNGAVFASLGNYLYFPWLFSLERLYGGTLDDILSGWRGPALPSGREGSIASMTTYIKWLILARDAGASGTSSVSIWDGFGEHEIFRAPAAGMRIRDVFIQVISGSRNRLWIDCGGDLIYMDLPLNKGNPLYDTSINYMPEGVLTSSTIDMGTASRLPKFFRDLTLTTQNLNGGGIRVEMDYQLDDDCGQDGIANWTTAPSAFMKSPESLVKIFRSATQFRYRLRLMTDDADVPPVVKTALPSGFARTPQRLVWNMRVVVGESSAPRELAPDPYDFEAWLLDAAREPGRVLMTSKWRNLHGLDTGRMVVVSMGTSAPISAEKTNKGEKTIYNLTLLEV